MKEQLHLKRGFRTLNIRGHLDYMTKKPTVLITCMEDCADTIGLDGEWVEEHEDATYYPTIDELDLIIEKLKEAKEFLQTTKLYANENSNV